MLNLLQIRCRNWAMTGGDQIRVFDTDCGKIGIVIGYDVEFPNNMDIQYAQAALFTPSDFAFPTTGIKAEAVPNSEMTVIADVNIDLLVELHTHGSVHTMRDRRHDLYRLEIINKNKKAD